MYGMKNAFVGKFFRRVAFVAANLISLTVIIVIINDITIVFSFDIL